MKYTYAPDFLFRGYERLPFVGIFPYKKPLNITPDMLEALEMCDGATEITEVSEGLDRLIEYRAVVPGEVPPKDYQEYRYHKNRYFPAAKWQITGRCNYRCKHCFNAVDNSPIFDEFTLSEAKDLIAQMEACGVHKIEVTGGEPTLHPNFMEILSELSKARINVTKINTNGSRITPELLAEIKSLGFHPLFAMSFDGIGFHDDFRGFPGAEKKLMEAIELLKRENLAVKIDTRVNAGNADVMPPTVKLMDSLGINDMRIARTMETPRWYKNSKEPFSERDYYEFALNIAEEYLKEPHNMHLNIWHVLNVYPVSGTIAPGAEVRSPYRGTATVCGHNRGMFSVTNSGELAPCNQMSGFLKEMGVSFGNVKKTPLQNLLSDAFCDGSFIKGFVNKKLAIKAITAMAMGKTSDGDSIIADLEGQFDIETETIPKSYLTAADMRLDDLMNRIPQCKACKYLERCQGGCRAIGLGITGSYVQRDITKCIWFHEGYADRLETLMKKHNKEPVTN
ncbi:MAG: radical SAM protein [Ruminococcus sp.]|jgi:radical SAM protein with 4Fe4S-binding SPASM domain|nr:radical SAM protein [Ruminococcus sp.]